MAYTETDLEITVDWLKDMLREKSSVADTEIRDLIESCVLGGDSLWHTQRQILRLQ